MPCIITFDLDLYPPWSFSYKTAKICHISPCPLCNICKSGCIPFIHNTNDHQHQSGTHIEFDFDQYLQGHSVMDLQQKLWKCCVCSKTYSILDGFFSYLAQMITNLRGVLCAMTFDLGDDYIQNVGILDSGVYNNFLHFLPFEICAMKSLENDLCNNLINSWTQCLFLYSSSCMIIQYYPHCGHCDVQKLCCLWLIYTASPL